MLPLVLLAACNGCQPRFPNGDDEPIEQDPPPDTDDTEDADSAETGDSGPPARCDVEEIEPNSPPTDTQPLAMEAWACGVFGAYVDLDAFRIEPAQPGWITVSVEASSRGSPANPQLIMEGGGESTQVLDGYLTTDPLLVFPAATPEPYTLTLGETDFLYGEDYEWFVMTSLSKEPVDWDDEEVEPNDVVGEAKDFALGRTLFGGISSPDDMDWYRITTTSEGEQTLTFAVTAFKEGSAANLVLTLYDSDGETVLRRKYSGEIEYDRDPYFTKKITGVQDLYLLVRNELEAGSRFHWYTLSVTSAE